MIINAHTHKIDKIAAISVLNFFHDSTMIEKIEGNLISCGIHPWHVKKEFIDDAFKHLTELCETAQIDAIGECGLDKYHKDFTIQLEVFKKQIYLSEQYALPLIIHSVKTHQLILSLRKETKAVQPWILHGFIGSMQMANQLIDKSIYLSIGMSLLNERSKLQVILPKLNIDFVLFETDDSDKSVLEVYKKAESLLCLQFDSLEDQIQTNFNRIFNY